MSRFRYVIRGWGFVILSSNVHTQRAHSFTGMGSLTSFSQVHLSSVPPTLTLYESFPPQSDSGSFITSLGLPLLPPQFQMTLSSAAIDAIFNRPRQAAAVLFLIEDSSYMIPLWPHLKDSYLPYLLNAIKAANVTAAVSRPTSALPLSYRSPPLQAEALWMTASEHAPFKHPFSPTTHRTPRWDDVPTIKFSSEGGNTISPASVARAIEVRQARFCHQRSDA